MKIICIGRNYVEHAKELKNDVPSEPVFFLKPDTALLAKGRAFFMPEFSNDIHHEVELVYKVCKEGKNIREEFASRYVDQISVGLDFTARDIQQKQKEKGLPWEPAKAFDSSSPVGEFMPIADLKKANDIQFHLELNSKSVQIGSSTLMIFPIEKVIAYVSQFITLKKGDLIYTGTPSGVGPVKAGDVLDCFLEGEKKLSVSIR